jgi:tRNA (guanine-N7-)-methyltransferase
MHSLPERHIRSFVRRAGHITDAQRQARDQLLDRWSLSYSAKPIDLKEIFQNDRPTILEIGFGMGESTAAIAAARPDQNILGVEVYPAGVGSLLGQISRLNLTNIRIIENDVVLVLRDMIGPECLDAVHIYFPDPWPKKRHHKRRLIQPAFVQHLCQKIKPGGYLHLATDWPDYADQMLEVLCAEPALKNSVDQGFAPRPPWRPLTKFEQRGLRLGFPPKDLLFYKK